jgi:hypothetical protein
MGPLRLAARRTSGRAELRRRRACGRPYHPASSGGTWSVKKINARGNPNREHHGGWTWRNAWPSRRIGTAPTSEPVPSSQQAGPRTNQFPERLQARDGERREGVRRQAVEGVAPHGRPPLRGGARNNLHRSRIPEHPNHAAIRGGAPAPAPVPFEAIFRAEPPRTRGFRPLLPAPD